MMNETNIYWSSFIENNFSDKALWYHEFTVLSSHLTFMPKLPLKNHIFVHKKIHQGFLKYVNSLLAKMFSSVTPAVLSYNFVQNLPDSNTHALHSFCLFTLRN